MLSRYPTYNDNTALLK